MSKKYKFTQQHMTGGNRCFGNLSTSNVCQQTIDVSQYLTPCQSLPLDSGFNQTAGGKYNYIVNPKTGRKVNINGKIGKQVLRKYLYNVQKFENY